MKKIFLFLAISLLSFAAQSQEPNGLPRGWKVLNGCGVSLTVPADIVFIEDQTVDTCERIYKGKGTSLHITVTEWNVGHSDYANWPDHCVSKILIDSKKAEIVTSKIPVSSESNKGLDFSAMLLAPDFLRGGRDLLIRTWSSSEKARNDALKIFTSVRMEPRITSSLSNPAAK